MAFILIFSLFSDIISLISEMLLERRRQYDSLKGNANAQKNQAK